MVTAVAAVLVVVSAGFLAYASTPMMAEEEPLARAESTVAITETAEGVVLSPSQPNGTGLVFFAGARVDPAAYANKLSGVAASGITVVIARPTLNFAILETRPLSTWEGLAPGIGSWAVGGHSLGGVRACMYAEDAANEVAGDRAVRLVLLGRPVGYRHPGAHLHRRERRALDGGEDRRCERPAARRRRRS